LLGAAHYGQRTQNRKSQEDREAEDRANGTQVRAHLSRTQVGQEMNLSSQKKYQEHQADNAAICAVYSHVLGKTQLRGESLSGQERRHVA
jgi:hypothetical protein